MSNPPLHEIQATAGETLRELRKGKKLSVQDIAAQMNLETRVIEALEMNNYEELPTSTYIRGYIRSYAKIIAADAESIIALYDDGAPEPPEIIPDIKHGTQMSSSDKPVKAFTYLLTFVLALLFLAWIQSKFMLADSSLVDSSTAETSPDALPDPKVVVKNPQSPNTPDTTETEEVFGPEQPKISKKSEPPLTLATDDKVQVEELTDINGPDSLLMKLTADSWIEIFDRDGKKLFLSLARSGDDLSINGNAPFKVKLGFAQGVSLEFNGQSFDPAPYSRAGVAHFTLGN